MNRHLTHIPTLFGAGPFRALPARALLRFVLTRRDRPISAGGARRCEAPALKRKRSARPRHSVSVECSDGRERSLSLCGELGGWGGGGVLYLVAACGR